MTTVVWQAAVTAGLLFLGLLRILLAVRRATRTSRTRITALHQALATLAHAERAAGTTPAGGTVLVFRLTRDVPQFELRHISPAQFARYSEALNSGAAATLRAHSFVPLGDHIVTRERITVRVPAGSGRARPVTEQRTGGLWGCLRLLGGAVLGTVFATPDELDDLLYATTTGLISAIDSPSPLRERP